MLEPLVKLLDTMMFPPLIETLAMDMLAIPKAMLNILEDVEDMAAMVVIALTIMAINERRKPKSKTVTFYQCTTKK